MTSTRSARRSGGPSARRRAARGPLGVLGGLGGAAARRVGRGRRRRARRRPAGAVGRLAQRDGRALLGLLGAWCSPVSNSVSCSAVSPREAGGVRVDLVVVDSRGSARAATSRGSSSRGSPSGASAPCSSVWNGVYSTVGWWDVLAASARRGLRRAGVLAQRARLGGLLGARGGERLVASARGDLVAGRRRARPRARRGVFARLVGGRRVVARRGGRRRSLGARLRRRAAALLARRGGSRAARRSRGLDGGDASLARLVGGRRVLARRRRRARRGLRRAARGRRRGLARLGGRRRRVLARRRRRRRGVLARRGGGLLLVDERLVRLDVRRADGVLEGLRRAAAAARAAGSAIGRGASAVLSCAGLVRAFAEHG